MRLSFLCEQLVRSSEQFVFVDTKKGVLGPARYSDLLVENHEFFYIFHLYLAPPQGVTPSEFRKHV